jgi:malic enzyme
MAGRSSLEYEGDSSRIETLQPQNSENTNRRGRHLDYGKESILRHRQTKGNIKIIPKMPLEAMDHLSIANTPGWPR